MRTINKVILMGRVGKDPDVRSISDDTEVATFSIATSKRWKDKGHGDWKEKTEWHNICVFDSYSIRTIKDKVRKGAAVYIEGELKTRQWKDGSGKTQYITEVHVTRFGGNFIFLDLKASNKTSDNNPKDEGGSHSFSDDFIDDDFIDDEIPF